MANKQKSRFGKSEVEMNELNRLKDELKNAKEIEKHYEKIGVSASDNSRITIKKRIDELRGIINEEKAKPRAKRKEIIW